MTAPRARLCVCCAAPTDGGLLCDMHEDMRRRVARIVARVRMARRARGAA